MIIYRQYHHEGAPVYEIITKAFQLNVTIHLVILKYSNCSLLQDDIDHMKVS